MTTYEEVSRLASVIGTHFYPLQNLGTASSFLWSLLRYPAGLPNRLAKIEAALRRYSMVSGLISMVRRSDATPEVQELISKLPPVDGMELITDLEQCVVCGESLTSEVYPPHGERREGLRLRTSPTVYGENGAVLDVTLCPKRCTHCKALHYLSYAEGGEKLPEGEQQYYKGSTEQRWFHVTKEIVWSTQLLQQYEAQAVCSHSGFETFVSEYAMRG